VAVVAPVTAVTAALREQLHARLAEITAGLGTALTEATERALALASSDTPGREGLAILLTDGLPFTGETRPAVIVERVRSLSRSAVLSTVGIATVGAPLRRWPRSGWPLRTSRRRRPSGRAPGRLTRPHALTGRAAQ
jgi:hypothetical protein